MVMSLRSLLFSLVAIGGRALTVSRHRSDLESPVVEIAYAGYRGALEGSVHTSVFYTPSLRECFLRTLE